MATATLRVTKPKDTTTPKKTTVPKKPAGKPGSKPGGPLKTPVPKKSSKLAKAPPSDEPTPATGGTTSRTGPFVTVLDDGLSLVHPPETEPAPRASEPPTLTLARHAKTGVLLKWVPGRTGYDEKHAANVYAPARLELHGVNKGPKVLHTGGRLSYDLLKKYKKPIDAAFGRELKVIDVSKTLVVSK